MLSITKVQVHAQHHLVTGVPANHTGADPGQAQGSWPLPYTMAEVFFFSILHIYTCSWFFSGKIFYRHLQVLKNWKISNADQIRATWNQFCAPIPFLGKKIIEVTLLIRCTRNHTYTLYRVFFLLFRPKMSDYIKNFTKKVSEFPKGLAVIFRAEQ